MQRRRGLPDLGLRRAAGGDRALNGRLFIIYPEAILAAIAPAGRVQVDAVGGQKSICRAWSDFCPLQDLAEQRAWTGGDLRIAFSQTGQVDQRWVVAVAQPMDVRIVFAKSSERSSCRPTASSQRGPNLKLRQLEHSTEVEHQFTLTFETGLGCPRSHRLGPGVYCDPLEQDVLDAGPAGRDRMIA
jgi:hypothetical protein